MIYLEGDLIIEVKLLITTLRRESGQVLTVTIDADGRAQSVKDNTDYELGVEELTEVEKRALKRLVGID